MAEIYLDLWGRRITPDEEDYARARHMVALDGPSFYGNRNKARKETEKAIEKLAKEYANRRQYTNPVNNENNKPSSIPIFNPEKFHEALASRDPAKVREQSLETGEDNPLGEELGERLEADRIAGKGIPDRTLPEKLTKSVPEESEQYFVNQKKHFGISIDSKGLIYRKEAELAKIYKGIISSDIDSEMIDSMHQAALDRQEGPKYNNRQLFGINTILTVYKNIGDVKFFKSAEDVSGYSNDFDELFYQVMSRKPAKVDKSTKRWKQVEYLDRVLSPEAKARFVEGFCNNWPTTKREAPNAPEAIYEPEAAGGYRRAIMDHLEYKVGELITKQYYR